MSAPAITVAKLRRLIEYSPTTGSFRWRVTRSSTASAGGDAGTEAKGGYLKIMLDGRQYSAARVAWAHSYGEWPTERVSFRDGNPKNRRLKNLRLGSMSQVVAHSRLRSDSTSGFKGVSREPTTGKWMAYVNKDKRRVYLGCFPTKRAAHAAYVTAARQIHGEFARSH